MARSTHIVFDTCSLINLMNGERLQSVLNIPYIQYYLGPAVYKEVSKIQTQKDKIDDFIESTKIIKWNKDIDINLISRLYDDYKLGDGETESLCICIEESFLICCDDRKARVASEKELTKPNVIGSLRLLKMAVIENVIKCNDAESSYFTMLLKGGFLPKDIQHNFFCSSK